MRKSLVVGILREYKENERRTPLTPADVAWLKKRFIGVEVEASSQRVFTDKEYVRAGASCVDRLRRATLILGVKEPDVATMQGDKIYMVFSHTVKGQEQNMPLLKACLKNNITLIDYEKITDKEERRLVYFGRFAGICGCIDALCYLGKKFEATGVVTPLARIRPAHQYRRLSRAREAIADVAAELRRKGLSRHIAPMIVGITGHGNVSQGVIDILRIFRPVEIHPKDMGGFVREGRWRRNQIYQIIFDREEKLRAKDGTGFYFEEYLQDPNAFESNMDRYLPHINLLIHTSYWDKRYPRLVSKEMIRKISGKKNRLSFIADLSCDVKGSIELTYRTTMEDNPVYTYNPKTRIYIDGYDTEGIAILARDNLPTELPRDASEDFSGLIREYVYQIAAHGIRDVTNHVALPQELRRAVITQDGKLTKPYAYLKKSLHAG